MTGMAGSGTTAGTAPWATRAGGWLRASRAGLFVIAVLVGAGSGLGAVAFRYLIYFFTWLATGHVQFGQDGYVGSSHLPWLGLAFFVVIPVIGGIIYGPLIYRYAREARGHGVPEVMIAVAENGGRIRPQVSVVKALASALCIGAGGSVGREGPIVQIGSALASGLGQWVRMPENRMRILVACGAGGGIAATFNAPITGVFFGVEIILRELSADALFTVMLSAMIADAGRDPVPGQPAVPVRIPLRHRAAPSPQLPAGRGPRRGRGPDRPDCSRPSCTRWKTCGTSPGRTGRSGPGPRSAASSSAWSCWRSRRCTASATPSWTRRSPGITCCGS